MYLDKDKYVIMNLLEKTPDVKPGNSSSPISASGLIFLLFDAIHGHSRLKGKDFPEEVIKKVDIYTLNMYKKNIIHIICIRDVI